MQSTQNMIHNNMQAFSMQLKAQSVMLVTVQKHAILLLFFSKCSHCNNNHIKTKRNSANISPIWNGSGCISSEYREKLGLYIQDHFEQHFP